MTDHDAQSNFFQYLLVLRARYRIVLFVLAVTVVTTTVVSLIIPKTYVATASLLVDSKDNQTLESILTSRQQSYQTQVDIITSQRVALKVVHDLKLAESPVAIRNFEDDAKGRGSIEDWLAQSLLKRLKVDTSSVTSVIQIIYSANDPKFAAAVANAFAKAYIDTNLELRVEPARQTSEWFDDQLKTLRDNLEQAQSKLTAYQKEKNIVSVDERFDVENTRLNELSSQLVQAQNQTYDIAVRQKLGAQAVSSGGSLENIPEVIQNPFIQSLKSDILKNEAQLKDLSTQLGPNHPQYQRLMSETQSLRERLDQEMKRVITSLEGSTHQSQQREVELKNAIEAQRAKVFELKQYRDQLAPLEQEVEAAQRAYDTAMQRFTVSKVDSRANQTNVSILTPAVEPLEASRPKVVLNIVLAVIIGSMLGMGVAFLLELADRRVRSISDLAGEPGVPLLAVLNSKKAIIPKHPLLVRIMNGASHLLSPG
ncbi:MAG TPA: chain length determinant protein EpsF [Burkholderiales bacterium]|nr:chain length determinant protein EpsF [Burkholderiales bacterium]